MSIERKNFPESLVAFIVVFEDILIAEKFDLLTPEVCRLYQAVGESLIAVKHRKAINRRFCGLIQYNQTFFKSIMAWLNSPEITKLFQSNGQLQQLVSLNNALEKINAGITPSMALGMHSNGAPPVWGFTKTQDAALYAHHLNINEGGKKVHSNRKSKRIIQNR